MSAGRAAAAAALLCLAAVAPPASCSRLPLRLRDPPALEQEQKAPPRARTTKPRHPVGLHVTELRKFPHEGQPWTQGLEFSSDGRLIESVGDYPPGTGSFLRVLDRETGGTLEKVKEGVEGTFAEGIAEFGGRFLVTTYQDHVAVEYDADLRFQRTLQFNLEGWGLARSPDGAHFLATNGTEHIMTLDPDTFEVTGARAATCLGKTVTGINELEMVDDLLGRGPALLGNVMNTRLVLALDPVTAECLATFHLEGLEPLDSQESYGFHVANGIAYDRRAGTFIVTGKNWGSMFEIRVSEDAASSNGQHALALLDRHLSSAPSA